MCNQHCLVIQKKTQIRQQDRFLATYIYLIRLAHNCACLQMAYSILNTMWRLHLQVTSYNKLSYQKRTTLSDKISSDKIFDGQNISSDKIFDTEPKFRQFCPIFT